ncbi:MAG: Peptidyl-tRNA hydrolase [Deltaproteobacteria bacterium ADurb.Bin510]|nr:MAG: Peptidyl-tRNA hydrolase [Deltaproteobacteria bacterium ADurb.Bin510]
MVVERLSAELGIRLDHECAGLRYGLGRLGGRQVLLAQPQTFMNRSGEPLKELGLRPENLLVIYDDLDLNPGQLRLRERGSAGGHRGLASIIENLATQDFARLRLGIGRDASLPVVDYVLSEFADSEREVLDKQIERAAAAARACLEDGVAAAMNRFNRNSD